MACLAPELRFDGYTDAWEQRKLGKMADFSKGQGYSKADLIDEGTPIILYGRLYTNYETVITNVDTFALEREGCVKSRGDEVIVPGSGETAEDISVASAVHQVGVLLGGDLNIVRPNNELDQTFLALAITGASPHDQMAKRAQGKTVVHLHNEDLKEIDIAYPSIAEQGAISDVFTRLDNLITLHQRGYGKLVTTKQSLLQKMFPKPGEIVPEVRFEGFEESWGFVKIGDILTEQYELTSDFKAYELCSLIIEQGVVPKPKRYDRSSLVTKEDSFFKIVPAGSFVSNPMNLRFGAIGFNSMKKPVSVSGYYDVFEVDGGLCSGFWNSYFHTDAMMKVYDDIATGSLIEKRRVQLPTFKEIVLRAPTSMREKMMVGSFFASFDKLIDMKSTELEKLKQLKSALLQKMLV